jgi:adenylate cyclase
MRTFSVKQLFEEALRRRVFRVAALYIVGAWAALQASDLAFQGLGVAETAIRYVWMGAILGLPIALFVGWRYDFVGGRVRRTAATSADASPPVRRADYIVLGSLAIVVALITTGLFVEILKTRVTETAPLTVTESHPNSIAVLPFVNMSDDPENEYFSDGISEEILNLLTKVPQLQVTSRSSAFSFKGQNVDVPTIAAKLNVAHVLEGSVRKSGDQVRITAQLIEVKTDAHLWSETYDRKYENIFVVQDEIAAAVVDALQITLLGNAPKAIETDPDAYSLYLQARYLMVQNIRKSNLRAETLLKQVIEIDPDFAPAWVDLGNVYREQATFYGILPVDEGIEMARKAIHVALDIDPDYGPAFAALAEIEMLYGWNFARASEHFQRALELSPGNAAILESASRLNVVSGRLDEAIDQLERAVTLSPVSFTAHHSLGSAYVHAQRLDDAADSIQIAISLSPDAVVAHWALGLVRLKQGDVSAAMAEMEAEKGSFFRLHGTALVQHALGDTEATNAALKKLIDCCARGGAFQIAEIYAIRGEIDLAFEWLNKAYDNRDGAMAYVFIWPGFDNLHDDPRWEPLLDKMGLPL